MARISALVLVAFALGCSHAQPTARPAFRRTFHYRSAALIWDLGKTYQTDLDANHPLHWVRGIHVILPHPGVVKVTSKVDLDPRQDLIVDVYVPGDTHAVVEILAPNVVRTPVIQSEAYIVIRAARRTRTALNIELLAELEQAPAPPIAAPASSQGKPALQPPPGTPAQLASPPPTTTTPLAQQLPLPHAEESEFGDLPPLP